MATGNINDLIAYAGCVRGCGLNVDGPAGDVCKFSDLIIPCPATTTCAGGGRYFVNGFDMTHAVLAYETTGNKNLYLGYRVAGLIGDTDGNGNPNSAGGPGCTTGANVTDQTGIGTQENYVWTIDTNCDGSGPKIQVSVNGALPNPTVKILNYQTGLPLAGAAGTATVTGSDLKVQVTGISDPVTGKPGLPPGFTWTGTVGSAPDGLSEDSFAPRSCTPNPNLTIEKTASLATLCPGATTGVRLTIHNTGDVALTSVTVTDDLPLGISYVAGSTGSTCNVGEPTIAAQKLTWNIGTLDADQTCIITFTAQRVGTACFGTVTNHSSVVGTLQAACLNNNLPIQVGPVTADFNLVCVDVPKVTLDLVCRPDHQCPGGAVNLDWTATNTSQSDETITLVIDGQIINLGVVPAGASRTGTKPAVMPATCPASGTVTFSGTADASNQCPGGPGPDAHATASCDVTCSLPPCTITGPTEIAQGETASLCGPGDPGLGYLWSTGATSQCIQTGQAGTYTLTVTDQSSGCKSTCSITLRLVSCACVTGYPDGSNPPRSQVIFNESEVLRAFDPGPAACGPAGGTIKLWYNDEHALTLGVRRVIVKSSSGTTTTDYPLTASPSAPTCVDHPQVGTQAATGDQSGNDVAAGGGRPLWPALFITDLTVNGASSRAGDWQQGGTGIAPHRVCGVWKGAVRTVDNTRVPAVVTVTPDQDPAKNNWNLDGGDTPPGGFGSLTNQGYGAECVWNVNELHLIPGHAYRLYFMVHDGDQNKSGGDVGQGCTTVNVPGNPPPCQASITPVGPLCVEGTPVTLTGNPPGGTFSGPGVTGNQFDPAAAGVGTWTITYQYTDPSRGCSSSASTQVQVRRCEQVCSNASSIKADFNGTAITGTSTNPAYIWFNSNFKIEHGTPVAGTQVLLRNGHVSINGQIYDVPDANITFQSVACATTSYDALSETWNTTVPLAGSDEIFLSGLALPIVSLKGGAKVTWSGTIETKTPGLCFAWKWSAAVYSRFTVLNNDPYSIDYNAANIKPTHANACGINNSDHAGAPQNPTIRAALKGGARGGGGSNWTGSWSGTAKFCADCPVAALQPEPVDPASLGQTPSGPIGDLDGPTLAPYPNPFEGSTNLRYVVGGLGDRAVEIGVFDVAGRRVRSLVRASQAPGRYETSWDGSSDQGVRMSNGMYFLRVVIANEINTRRVLYLHR